MRVAVGISGGVDSAVTAMLLKERGHEVVGVTMALGRDGEEASIADAKSVADWLGIEFKVFDLAVAWKREVLEYIRGTYLAGRTPNPCVRCNEMVKFGMLPYAAFEQLGCDRFATGHYARIEPRDASREISPKNVMLLRGTDRTKDQSYFLYRVRPEVLAKTLFPLGAMSKTEVREIARSIGFKVAEKGDSQDFCGGDPMGIVGAADREGDIVTVEGKVLGKHRGYWNYTIGKRKGLGIGGGIPYYVIGLDAENNRVIVGYKDASVRYDLELTDEVGTIDKSLPVKVRSAGEPRLLSDGISGIAPGQSAVFFRGEEVVGGGIIKG